MPLTLIRVVFHPSCDLGGQKDGVTFVRAPKEGVRRFSETFLKSPELDMPWNLVVSNTTKGGMVGALLEVGVVTGRRAGGGARPSWG